MSITNYIKTFLVALIFFAGFSSNSIAQWINDPSSNTKLVIDPVDPINISAIRDLNGGAYVYWQDKKNNAQSDIYFIHFNKNGEVSFRTDGKAVSTNVSTKENPIVVIEPSGNSIVIWKDSENKKRSELFVQKLSPNGLRLWNTTGLQITNLKSEIIDYSLKADKKGFAFISYIIKTANPSQKYYVKYQKINPNGRMLSDSSKGFIHNSNSMISETQIIPDNKGGSFIFWIENVNQKSLIHGQYVDSAGSKKWGSKPIVISKANTSVINYSIGKMGNSVYAAITYQGTKKIVYQQLITDKGKQLWGTDGKLLTDQKGSQTNPKFVFIDSSVVVSWTNEFEKHKDIFIQRFDFKGKSLWGSNGKRIINIKGDQFGQRIVYDQKGGVIIAWIDKRENNSVANLFVQKVDLKGNFVWDSTGVTLASSKNEQKSYLNLIPDESGGAIAIFRGSIGGKNNIYGQKIFSTGTYASQILGFSSEVVDDSVKIFWYAANETDGTSYIIQRTDKEIESESNWKAIGTLKKENKKQSNYYEFHDYPEISGSIFYRVVQKDNDKQIQISSANKVDYFRDVESVILGQNSPNPFSGSTTINFYLPEEDDVTLEFFSSNIETVKKIENEKYPAGKNSFVFNANGLKPGIYFYRLKVNDFVDVKKMVISE